MFKRLIKIMRIRRVCRANGYNCPECIYHEFLFDGVVFRGVRCRLEQERENQKPQWISVKDRLPIQNIDNSSGDCLIAIKYAYDLPDEERSLCSGYLLDGEWWSYGDHSCHKIGDKNTNNEGDVVTHWMPLPEPPKEEQK